MHSILWDRDTNKVIEPELLVLAQDLEEFINYPWGYESYLLTGKYLLSNLSLKTFNLYRFPWAFMVNFITISFVFHLFTLLNNYSIFFCIMFILLDIFLMLNMIHLLEEIK